ncbi:hypothetical protein [Inhella sp.]|uniref:hypothetical protein n=1 Tax=Inhella sp. TaxID=1921806 RepID=UPI0035AE6D18
MNPAATAKQSLTVATDGTHALHPGFDRRRKQQEVLRADWLDEVELKALERTLKHRPKP